ncbi:MAG: type 1 glutamine amidotransferase [Pseudomonadota bacterium]
MQIGILQCGHTPPGVAEAHGDYDALFHRLFAGQGLSFTTWNVVDMDFPADPFAADGWLITGSKHGAYEPHAFIPPLEDFIRATHAAKRPLIGICFGHQIIAQALGGRVEKFEGGWAIGRAAYALDGAPLHLNAWHQDQVIEPPESARTLAASDFCAHAALRYGDHILTMQPHPEIPDDVLATYLDTRGQDAAFPADIIAQARADIGRPSDEAQVATMLATFLKEARQP